METRSDLATGYARTANARSRVQNGWEDIARDLHSDGNGCVKNWKQWAKETDNISTVPQSSNQSESILLQGIAGPSGAHRLNIIVDEDVLLEWANTAAAVVGEGSVREALESRSAVQRGVNIDGVLQDEDETGSLNDDRVAAASHERESPSAHADGARGEESAPRRLLVETPSPQAGRRRSLPSQRGSVGSPSRRRVLRGARTQGGASAARRRLLRRSPPSQHRSEMASLTERFIAIEERRADAELAIARSQETFVQAYRSTAEALNRLTNTIEIVAPQIVEAIQQLFSRH